ncbi:hypothetical protein [Streptomyces sp. NBC_00425]|uniref:hypothetical protein n=1 Tax=Streptomyces sp. NBC_00425 TaxID=2975740 RepID=UPI002E23D447
MSEDLFAPEVVERAVADFDRALSEPGRAADAMGALFQALGAAAAQQDQERRAARTAWRNRPEAKAARSAAAKKAAATRAAKKAAERAAQAAEDERDARVPTVHCPHMDFVPYGSGETECVLTPGHLGDDHEDLDGHTWPSDDCNAEECGEACGF